MVIIKDTETRVKKVFRGTAFTFKLGESKEKEIRRKLLKDKIKESEIGNIVQKGMKKHTPDVITGQIWQEDFNDIFAEVMNVVKTVVSEE